jgi:hypothetical protein
VKEILDRKAKPPNHLLCLPALHNLPNDDGIEPVNLLPSSSSTSMINVLKTA